MRLHGTITPDLPLLVVALEEEAVHLGTHGLPVLVTGAGKVNAAIATALTLGSHSPSQVVNLGTAGALVDGLTGIHVISTVTQHDLNDEALFHLTGLHFGPPIALSDTGLVLTTGDQFIADAITRQKLVQHAHLVDMEGYAIAKASIAANVPVMLVKQVSDSADNSAARSWRETVDYCAEQLGAWVMEHLST
jgi:adenosylhomocysteine nucleosidase